MDSSRRAVLGLAAAAAAAVVVKPTVAEAADGQALKGGVENLAEARTYLTGGRNSGLTVTSTTDDGAVAGVNTAHDGAGLRGTGAVGVVGIGIQTDLGGGVGVDAGSDHGVGLQAGTWDGTAVKAHAEGPGSTALDVTGVTKFSRSGRTRVPTGAKSVTINVPVGTGYVLATLQAHKAGLYVEGVQTTPTGFTIWLSKATTGLADVAWFIVG
jgi:hypothetical protein